MRFKCLAEHDDVIEAFAADRADQSFDVGILPRRAQRAHHLFDSQILDSSLEHIAIDSIAIALQVARRRVIRKRLDDLLGAPLGRWIGRDIEMHDATPLDFEHDEDIEHAKGGGRHGEEVDRDQFAQMVLQKRLPRRRRRIRSTNTILAHRRFGDVVSEQFQFGLNAQRAPTRILATQAANQLADFMRNSGPPILAQSATSSARTVETPRNANARPYPAERSRAPFASRTRTA